MLEGAGGRGETCPRCGGRLFRELNEWSEVDTACINCGYRQPPRDVLPKSNDRPGGKFGRRMGNG